jgi:hypothetical protein
MRNEKVFICKFICICSQKRLESGEISQAEADAKIAKLKQEAQEYLTPKRKNISINH